MSSWRAKEACPACNGQHRRHICGKSRPNAPEQGGLFAHELLAVGQHLETPARAHNENDDTSIEAANCDSTHMGPSNLDTSQIIAASHSNPLASTAQNSLPLGQATPALIYNGNAFRHDPLVRTTHFLCAGCNKAIPRGNELCPICMSASPGSSNATEVAKRQRVRSNVEGCPSYFDKLVFFSNREQQRTECPGAGCALSY